MEPTLLQPRPIPVEPVPTPEQTPEQKIIEAYLAIPEIQKIFNLLEGDDSQEGLEIKKQQLTKAMETKGFLTTLEQTETDPQLDSKLTEDLEIIYGNHKNCPQEIVDLHDRTFQALHVDSQVNPALTLNSLDYLNKLITYLTSIPDLLTEKPHLQRLLTFQQEKLARLLISLRQYPEKKATKAAA